MVVEKQKRSLPEDWNWLKLKDICEPDKKLISPESNLASRPYLSLEHIESKTGQILRAPIETVEDEGRSMTYAFDERHVLYGKLRPYLNKVALPDFDGRCTTELIPFLPKKFMDRKFLAWLLRRDETVQAAMDGKTGSRMPRADLNALLNLEIPLPPLETQRRIAATLEAQLIAVAQARAAAEAQLEAAREMHMMYLTDAFSESQTNHWSRGKLGDVLRLQNDVVHPRNSPTGAARFVGLEHVQSNTGARTGHYDLNLETLTGRKPKFTKGNIVYGYLRPYLNKVWIAEFDGLCSVDQYVFSVVQEKASVEYVAAFMRSPSYLKRAPINATPGQLPRIRTDEVLRVELPLPPLEEQARIVTKLKAQLEGAAQLVQSLQSQLEAINAMPAALLREAFSGRL
jgi:restriction endonuclease S subunit